MTKKDLVKVIRKLVREEVKKEVGKILISERKTISERQVKKPVIKKYKTKPTKKVYTKDNVSLNDILNETVGLTKGPQEEYPDMGGKTYTTQNMADAMGYGDMASPELQRDKLAAQTLAEKNVTPDQVGDGVVNALTRDYSDLMKVINKGK
jgi:hypothetical protein|tara:strand:+ start:922 stop:1374 length:453 start_codon:yes stop_codon:yes gene_type:complete